MKKLFFIAIASLMMFAFVQCTTNNSGFDATKRALTSAIKGVNNAKNCEELKRVTLDFAKEMQDLSEKYPDANLSDNEVSELFKLTEEYSKAALEKNSELCY